MIDIEKLEELEQAATPGPWEVANGKKRHFCLADCAIVGGTDTEYGLRCIAKCNDNFPGAFADARLITAARNALSELLAEVKRLRGVESAAIAFMDANTAIRVDMLQNNGEAENPFAIYKMVAAINALRAALAPQEPNEP